MNIRKKAYHRNGVSGEGFHVFTFTWVDDSTGCTRHMVGVLFGEQGQCAILDVDELVKDNIEFARGNSWRGDHFEPELRKVVKEEEDRNHELDKAYEQGVTDGYNQGLIDGKEAQ